jgi:DNA-binding NarL/FixJ family response regulator
VKQLLEKVGVAPEHEAVYRALLAAPGSSCAELTRELAADPDDLRASVLLLEELGLVTRTSDIPPRLIPARPEAAIGVLVARRRLELDHVEAEARQLAQEMQVREQHRPDNLVEVVVGREAIAARFDQLMGGASAELLVLDRPPYAAGAESSDRTVRALLREGVAVRGIYSPDSLAVPGAIDAAYSAAHAGECSRTHPQVPMKLAIFDRRAALLPLSMNRLVDSALVVHESSLLEALVQMFLLLWDQALPVVQEATPDEDAQLLTLLTAGLKDEAIARQLGLSARTVRRRLAQLMELLGARTRFQAGVYSMRRGLTSSSDQ